MRIKSKKTLSTLLAFALTFSLLAAMPLTAFAEGTISLSKSDYASGEKMTVTFSGVTDKMIEDGAFIAWYLAGAVAGDSGDSDYPKTASGTLTLDAPQHANNFEMRLYSKGVFSNEFLVMSVPFTVNGGPVEQPEPPAPEGSMDNFLQMNTYKPGQFTDVNEDQWFGFNQQKVVARAFEYGLMKGSSADTFSPTGNITVAEAVTVAARVRSIYRSDAEGFVTGNPWYQVYVDYAVAKGIIKAGDFTDYNRAATRAEMAYIFANALPDPEYGKRWYTNWPPDVDNSTQYWSEIIKLYNAGIVGGSDDLGTFHPANNITRAEAAAILSRLIKAVPLLGSMPMPS